MKRLTDQQLQTLLKSPFSKEYTLVRVAAEEELKRRSINAKENLLKFENTYFISKSSTRTKVVKTSEWGQRKFDMYWMPCEYIEFSYDDRCNEPERHFFTITEGKCSWHSEQREYLEKNYVEITEEEWLKWVEKFKIFYSTMQKLKDWE